MILAWLLACNQMDTGDGFTPRCLDVDGDGVAILPLDGCPAPERDCDDHDPQRFPGNDEVPYDRVDQDCDEAGADLVDVDEDGFPGIARSEWEAITRDPSTWHLAEWPIGVADGNDASTLDCDDESEVVYPGADDAPDDGVDQDCDSVE